MNASPRIDLDRFLRVPEIAKLLGCCERIVWAYFSSCKLPRRRHPAGTRISGCLESDVQAFLSQVRDDHERIS